MISISLSEALGRLDELIQASTTETIIIISGDRAVCLTPVHPPERRARHAGSAAGRVHMAPDFDAPLADFDEYS